MNIAIVGTGSVALATAALLARSGHSATLISITGEGAKDLSDGSVTSTGAFDLTFGLNISTDAAEALHNADGVIIATSANRYRPALNAIIPQIQDHHQILVSNELSQVSAVLEAELSKAGKSPIITSLSTTLVTGRRMKDSSVRIGIIRKSALACTRPSEMGQTAITFWNLLFSNVLTQAPSPIHITLSNLNPIIHIPNALCNFTRMEKGEEWSNYDGITEGVAEFVMALDNERVALAQAFGLDVKTLKTHYEDNFGFSPNMSLSQMTVELHVRRDGLPKGPATIETRYITEDVPFGLVVFETLARKIKVPTPVTSGAITVASALYGRDFRHENHFLEALSP